MMPDEKDNLNCELLDASREGDTERVNTLLAHDDLALRRASRDGDTERVKTILAVGEAMNVSPPPLPLKKDRGLSPNKREPLRAVGRCLVSY